MDHAYISEHSLIERYHLGNLPPGEEMRFEAHFVACPECTAELEAARGFRIGMKTVAAEEITRAHAVAQLGLIARLTRLSRQWPGVLTGALAAVVLTSGWFLVVAPSTERASLSAPVANTPVFILSTVRSTEETGAVVELSRAKDSVALAVDVDFDPRITGYRVSVVDSAEQVRWQQSDLMPNDLEILMVTFPASFFKPGAYRLTVEGQVAEGEAVALQDYPFQVAE